LTKPLARFPSAEVQTVALLILLHLALAFWSGGPLPPGRELLIQGGLLRGATLEQPWRLLTSLFLHSGPAHVLWNGLSTLVFAVPLLGSLGLARTGSVYLLSGVGGGLAALQFAAPGTLIVGSSGAVAGLFGAWVVLTLRRARRAPLGGRERIRAMGIALLVLPTLVRPVTSAGEPISVSSHLGGLVTGMLIGAFLSAGLARPEEFPDEDEENSGEESWSTGRIRD
jgi:membrane associated rhomboid family serine protease